MRDAMVHRKKAASHPNLHACRAHGATRCMVVPRDATSDYPHERPTPAHQQLMQSEGTNQEHAPDCLQYVCPREDTANPFGACQQHACVVHVERLRFLHCQMEKRSATTARVGLGLGFQPMLPEGVAAHTTAWLRTPLVPHTCVCRQRCLQDRLRHFEVCSLHTIAAKRVLLNLASSSASCT